MAQLSTIISSILHDFIQAQHEANCYSLALEREYGNNGKAREFQLPNAVIGDLEFELKYAVTGEGESKEEYVIDYPQIRRFFKEISEQLAKIVVTSVVATISSASIGVEDGYDNFHNFMKREETLKHEFCAFLSRKICGVMIERVAEIVTTDGHIDEDVLIGITVEVVRSEFLLHPDLDDLFSGKTGESLKAEAEDNLKYAVGGLMGKLISDFNGVRKHAYPSIEVAVTADELQKLPQEALQCVRFRISQREMDEVKMNGGM